MKSLCTQLKQQCDIYVFTYRSSSIVNTLSHCISAVRAASSASARVYEKEPHINDMAICFNTCHMVGFSHLLKQFSYFLHCHWLFVKNSHSSFVFSITRTLKNAVTNNKFFYGVSTGFVLQKNSLIKCLHCCDTLQFEYSTRTDIWQ